MYITLGLNPFCSRCSLNFCISFTIRQIEGYGTFENIVVFSCLRPFSRDWSLKLFVLVLCSVWSKQGEANRTIWIGGRMALLGNRDSRAYQWSEVIGETSHYVGVDARRQRRWLAIYGAIVRRGGSFDHRRHRLWCFRRASLTFRPRRISRNDVIDRGRIHPFHCRVRPLCSSL